MKWIRLVLITIASMGTARAMASNNSSANKRATMNLHNVRLLVVDFDRMFSFYKEKVGLEVAWGGPGDVYAEFKLSGGGTIALFKRDLMAQALGTTALPSNAPGQDRFGLVIFVENLDEMFKALQSKGVAFVTEPVDRPDWGIRIAHFRDPDGNLIELASKISHR
jgi:catechol 2,3-dioxygenase-like lactoylglutathione lyase family enzyme